MKSFHTVFIVDDFIDTHQSLAVLPIVHQPYLIAQPPYGRQPAINDVDPTGWLLWCNDLGLYLLGSQAVYGAG